MRAAGSNAGTRLQHCFRSHALRVLRQAFCRTPARSIERAMRSNGSTSRRASMRACASRGSATALSRDDRAAVQAASQALIDALVAGYRVPRIRVRVLAQRPADETGELHGLYEPEDEGERARITRVDAHRGAPRRRRVQDVPAHARPRALPSPRLRALQAARNISHRRVLQARVDACQRAVRAGSAQAGGS